MTDTSVGLLSLQPTRLDDVNTYDDGDIIPVTLLVVDATTFEPVDPDTVTIRYIPAGDTLQTLTWSLANWDGTTIETPAVGTVARVSPGTFVTWIPTAGQFGIWYCDAATTGAGEGNAPKTKWVVLPNLTG